MFNQNLFKTLLFCFSLCFIFSCGSDSDDIGGTYKITSISLSGCQDPSDNFNFNLEGDGCQDIGGTEVCVEGTMIITSATNDFSVTFSVMAGGISQSTTISGTYMLDGNVITICETGGDCETSTIDLGNNEVTIRVPEDEDGCITTIRGEK